MKPGFPEGSPRNRAGQPCDTSHRFYWNSKNPLRQSPIGEKRWFLLCFQHLDVLGGLLRALFSVFLISDRIYDRFFGFRSFFRFFRSYLRPFFGFRSFFQFFSVFSGDVFSTSVFTGTIRLHAARALSETSGTQQRIIPDQSSELSKV